MDFKYEVGDMIVTVSYEPRDGHSILFIPDMRGSLGKQLRINDRTIHCETPAYHLTDGYWWYEHWLNPIEVESTITIENEEFLKALGM